MKKEQQACICTGRGCRLLPPMQGRVGWTFPEREPGLALAPGALATPHPSLLQRAAKTSSGQDYVYWVDHEEASGTDPGKQRGTVGGGEGTSIKEETDCVHHPFPFLPALRGRQRADEWIEHSSSSIREVVDSVAGPNRGRRRGVPFTSSPAPRTQLGPFDLLKFPRLRVWVGGAGPSFASSLSFACPELVYFGLQSLDSSHGAIQIQQKLFFLESRTKMG